MGKDKCEALHSGKLYCCLDPGLREEQLERAQLVYDYNMTRPNESQKRESLLKEMFLSFGKGSYIETPFQANWAGKFVSFGKNVYANYNLVLVDDTYITVGDLTQFGPNVTLTTAGHPINPEERAKGLQFNKPITIGSNCWLGSGVTVLPGVTIGDNAVIGAGSVVTRDIPANCVAYGVPCQVRRRLNPKKET